MTSFERRRRLVELIALQPGLRVPEIAGRLNVSQGTVRNDLKALASMGQLTRVRGGATLAPDSGRALAFAARARINHTAKRQIARAASELVQDGDLIFLDASTTIYQMAAYLHGRSNLTIVTNGLQVAGRLAPNTSNKVILLGGILAPDGTFVSGPLSEQLLRDLHVKRAFVSASGLALEAGLTEMDIDAAHLKARALGCAEQVVALVDSSKFGRVDLRPFARLEEVSHLYTDSGVGREWIEKFCGKQVRLYVCGEDRVEVHAPNEPEPEAANWI